METKSFLKGYFYCSFLMNNTWRNNNDTHVDYCTDLYLSHVELILNNSTALTFAVNRGISPQGGNVAMVANHSVDSSFDIALNWTAYSNWKKLPPEFHTELDENGVIRIDLDTLCDFIDILGGIDYNATYNNIHGKSKNNPYPIFK